MTTVLINFFTEKGYQYKSSQMDCFFDSIEFDQLKTRLRTNMIQNDGATLGWFVTFSTWENNDQWIETAEMFQHRIII